MPGNAQLSPTSVKIRHDKSLTRHPARLVDQHVRSLVIRVIGHEETRWLDIVRVQGFDDLSGLRCVSMGCAL
jgi:hypothetical protein